MLLRPNHRPSPTDRTARRLAAAAFLLPVFLLAACGDGDGAGSGSASGAHDHGDATAAFPESEADTRVEVTASDFAFALPTPVKGGKVLFTVRNTGRTEHEFEVVGADGEPVGAAEHIGAGESTKLAVRLAPGAYTAQCLVKEGDKTHAELGMKTTFSVT